MAELYPTQVGASEALIEQLTYTFKNAYTSIVGEISTATDFGVANRKAILAQIEGILDELGVEANEYVTKEITKQYKVGADEAVKQLKNVGADLSVREGFNTVHKDAIAGLVDDTAKAFGESMTGVNRNAQLLLGKVSRETLTQKIAEGVIGGKARREVNKAIKMTLQEQGLDALVDKAGRSWSLDRYADMLFRTKSVEARNRGLINRMAENGYDLVQVSSHGASCQLCAPYEGDILSSTGQTPGYTTVSQAEANGLFHPNCRHAINALIPSLAKLTRAYDPNEDTLFIDSNTIQNKLSKPGKTLLPAYEKIASRELLQPATEYKEMFDEKLQNVANNASMDWKDGPVKGAPRTAEKILYDYNGNIFAMKDVNRSVFFISDPADKQGFDNLVKAVEQQFGPVASKDLKFGLDVTDSYASNKISVPTPYGAKAEIQITTKEMWRAKIDLEGDKLYGIWRDPNTNPAKAQEAYEKMKILYNNASLATKQRLGL